MADVDIRIYFDRARYFSDYKRQSHKFLHFLAFNENTSKYNHMCKLGSCKSWFNTSVQVLHENGA
jgi:hypothetical protein